MKNKKTLIIWILILGFVLRAYGTNQNFNFTGEFGQNLLDIKNTIGARELPLVGPATSHPWLYFGPLYYWLGMILMQAFGKSPLIFAWLGVLVGVGVVILNYLVVKKIFGAKGATISSLFIAISPLFIQFSKDARFFSFVIPLTYLLMWCLYKIWNKDLRFMFWAGIALGVMFSFHYSPLIFIPVILILFCMKRKNFKLKDYFKFIFGFMITNIPVLVYDSQRNFEMLKNLALWIPYRITGFFGLYPKNNLTRTILLDNFASIINFFGGVAQATFVVVCIVYMVSRVRREKVINFGSFFLLSTLFFGLLAIFIHGNPPIHYFLPIFPIPLLIVSLTLKRQILILAFLFLLLFSLILKPVMPPGAILYKTQLAVAKLIVEDAGGKQFSLARVGPYDYFDKNYSQNYIYLMWYFGNEPVNKSNLSYTIYEQGGRVSVSK